MIPILLFCYNRPVHTERTISSLLANKEAKGSDLYVFVDGPRQDRISDNENVNKVIDVIKRTKGFKSVSLVVSAKNKGLANSVIIGVSEIIEKNESVIVLEDDLLLSQDFLFFMNTALKYYQNNNSIGSVSGYSFNPVIPPEYKEDVFLSQRASSWGWGTWKDRWQSVDWEVKDLDIFLKDRSNVEQFKFGGEDLLPMIVKYKKGVIDSWAIRWTYHHFTQEQFCLVPRLSKVQNIGTDGSGTNFTNVNDRYQVAMGEKDVQLSENPKPDSKILESFKKVYSPSFYRKCINFLKYRVW